MADGDDYIFLSEDPLAPIRAAESEHLRGFQKSLTPEEKEDCKSYIKFLNWPITSVQVRMNRNLAVMCFMDGVRFQKIKKTNLDPSYVQALFQVAVQEIAAWSGMKEEAIRQMLPQKIHEYVAKHQHENKTPTQNT